MFNNPFFVRRSRRLWQNVEKYGTTSADERQEKPVNTRGGPTVRNGAREPTTFQILVTNQLNAQILVL